MYYLMTKKIASPNTSIERYQKPQEDWEYIEDPTYSRSIGSHVCLTCLKFNYSTQPNYGSILSCNWHQKLICHGQHLTHSCEMYQKKFFGFNKVINRTSLYV